MQGLINFPTGLGKPCRTVSATMPSATMRKIFLGALLSIAVLVPCLSGQSKNGTIAGSVQDSQKDPLQSARVILINAETKETYQAISNQAGEYRVQVPPGYYIVTAELRGFRSAKRPSVGGTVKENESTKLDPITLLPFLLPLAPVIQPTSRV